MKYTNNMIMAKNKKPWWFRVHLMLLRTGSRMFFVAETEKQMLIPHRKRRGIVPRVHAYNSAILPVPAGSCVVLQFLATVNHREK